MLIVPLSPRSFVASCQARSPAKSASRYTSTLQTASSRISRGTVSTHSSNVILTPFSRFTEHGPASRITNHASRTTHHGPRITDHASRTTHHVRVPPHKTLHIVFLER